MRFHRSLDGGSEAPPYEWVISRLCDEFHCLPSQAVRELEDGDRALVFDILELRTYARAKDAIDQAQHKDDVKPTPAIQKVFDVMAALMKDDGPQVR